MSNFLKKEGKKTYEETTKKIYKPIYIVYISNGQPNPNI